MLPENETEVDGYEPYFIGVMKSVDHEWMNSCKPFEMSADQNQKELEDLGADGQVEEVEETNWI